jgi:hypothetical protein
MYTLKSYTLALSDDVFVCYLYHGVSPQWSGFTGNPEHPAPHIDRMTEGLLYQIQYISITIVPYTFRTILSILRGTILEDTKEFTFPVYDQQCTGRNVEGQKLILFYCILY